MKLIVLAKESDDNDFLEEKKPEKLQPQASKKITVEEDLFNVDEDKEPEPPKKIEEKKIIQSTNQITNETKNSQKTSNKKPTPKNKDDSGNFSSFSLKKIQTILIFFIH